MRRPLMSKQWMLLWSAIAVVLLWKWADIMPARTAMSWADGTMFSRKGLASLLQRGAVNASDSVNGSMNSRATDSLSHPPLTQSFVTGSYRFVVAATDDWQTPAAIGQLYRGDSLLWESSLPQQYGPRFVVVGTQGHVLLVDEFINVASPYALLLLDAAGEPIATYAFEDIQQVLSVSAADLTQQATSGWWVSSAPQVEPTAAGQFDGRLLEETVFISAGGRRLAVDLLTGELMPAQDL